MSRPVARFVALVVLPIGLASGAVHSATFDLIYADHLNVTTYPSNDGFVLAGHDIGLVVNTGTADITGSEFFGATFTAISSNPVVTVHPFIFNPGPSITPIHPGEALGSVVSDNSVLTTRLLAGETLRNTAPLQVISIDVGYPPGFAGSAAFDITMRMGTDLTRYLIVANFVEGSSFTIEFPSASRVASVPDVTPARRASWGRLKGLYR